MLLRAYIGESETVGTRIKQHDVNKDWWTQAIFVTTTGNELNKAHVRYLEARMIQTAARVGHTPLTNGTAPPLASLSEADIGKMEVFLDSLFLALPALRVDLFTERARPNLASAPAAAGAAAADSGGTPRFVLNARKYGIKATAFQSDGEFVVEAGSLARGSWEGIGADAKSLFYDELRRANVLEPQGDHCVFTQNYAFKSPSAAASIVTGRSANGTIEWRTEAGQTYKDWERQALGLT